MSSAADGQLRLEFGDTYDQKRYRCPCRECALREAMAAEDQREMAARAIRRAA